MQELEQRASSLDGRLAPLHLSLHFTSPPISHLSSLVSRCLWRAAAKLQEAAAMSHLAKGL